MNKFIKAIQSLGYDDVEELITKEPKWLQWAEKTGKNALHYLGSVDVSKDTSKAVACLKIAKLLLKNGMDVNAIHKISEGPGFFPATPVWYAYARGRNAMLYKYFLKCGASPDHCMFAIAWNDDVKAAELFKKYGAEIDGPPLLAAYYWKKFKIMKWFLKNGSDISYIGPEGYSVLLLAVKRRAPVEQIKLLLKHGADFNQENKEGVSPKKLAKSMKQRTVLTLFEPRGKV